MNSQTGRYQLQLRIENKFTEKEEEHPIYWKFNYYPSVSREVFKKYEEKLSTDEGDERGRIAG
jgi:hypothetical protein